MKKLSKKKVLNRKFYQTNTLKVAQKLLGCFLVRRSGKKIIRGMIIETEAYIGEDDLACHASRGRTARTEVMYGVAGHAYVYMIYGMYHCVNVVTEKKNFPAAVLIRGIKIENKSPFKKGPLRRIEARRSSQDRGIFKSPSNPPFLKGEIKLDGPGKLCKFLKIDRKLNKWDLTKGEGLWIEKPAQKISKKSIVAGRRISIDYARHCRHYLWRFHLDEEVFLK